MIKPKALKQGDKVAIVSLSSGMGGEKAFIHRYYTGVERKVRSKQNRCNAIDTHSKL